jgi:hypothetical protein
MNIFLVIYVIGIGFSAIYYSKQYSEDMFTSTTRKGADAFFTSILWPIILFFYALGKIGEWLDSKF